MPFWVSLLVKEGMKYITPELMAMLEGKAKQYAVDELRRVVKTTPSTLDDQIVEKVAAALGVK